MVARERPLPPRRATRIERVGETPKTRHEQGEMAAGIIHEPGTNGVATRMDELEAALKIDRNDLDEDNIQNPQLYYEVAEQVAQATSRRDAAKLELDRIQADVEDQVRRDAAVADEKITEAGVKQQVRLNRDVDAALHTHLSHSNSLVKWQALLRAYDKRGDALDNLTKLYVAGYFTIATGRQHRSDAEHERNRRTLAEARRKDD